MNDIVNAINIPALDSVEYASGLNSAFENINRNFMTLGNSEFLKGQMGDSVRVIEMPLYKDGAYTTLGNTLLSAISELATESELGSVTIGNDTLSWDDNIKLKPMMQMICNDTSTTDTIVSSLYYMVHDGRYANKDLGFAAEEEYVGKKDISCIVIYNGVTGKFDVMTDSFPTLYYEDGVGLCWRINGSNTGLPVRGLTGKDGQNATFDVIRCRKPAIKDGETVYSEVTDIFEQFYGYRPLEEYNFADAEFRLSGQSVIILAPTIEEEDSGNSFYFGKVGKNDGKLYAYYGTGTSVSTSINIEEIVNLLKNISITANSEDISSKIKGLFIPMDKEQSDGSQAVHIMSATGIVNEIGNESSKKTDFIFTPIDDINNLDITPLRPLEVGKFLYLELDTNSSIFKNDGGVINPYPGFNSQSYTEPIVLKYKLDSVVSSFYNEDGSIEPRFSSYTSEDLSQYAMSSRYFGDIYYDGDVSAATGKHTLNEDNIVYVIPEEGKLTFDMFKTMPNDFGYRLGYDKSNGRGIYRWVLCDEVHHDFDADWLLNFDSYDFDKRFGAVFTTTVTPGLSTDIMWFNGMELYNGTMYDENGTIVDILPNNENESFYFPIIGWTTNTPFKFHKFVPVYFHGHYSDAETAMNLNYNVNITGLNRGGAIDESKRNLNVHGDINCENINVYRLTATGEIANIYTKDTIVSDSGIELRDVNADGDIVNKTSITPNVVDTNTINAKSVNADIVSPDQLKVLTTNMDVLSNDGKTSVLSIGNYEPHGGTWNTLDIDSSYQAQYDAFVERIKNESVVDLNNVKQINIKRGENFNNAKNSPTDSYDEVNVSICKTDLPVIFENDAAIIVSNNRPIEDIAFHGHYGFYRTANNLTQYEKTVNNDAMCTYSTSFSQELDYIQNHYLSSYNISGGVNTSYPFTSPFIMFSGTGLEKSRDCSTILHNNSTTGKLSLSVNDKNRLLNSAVCYYEVPKYDGRKFTKFNINFSKQYELVINTGSKCSYGNWPHLHSDSYMQFDVLAEINGDLYRLVQEDKTTYKFDYTGAWCGYEHSGSYKTIVRSYVFKFNPYDINVVLSSSKNKAVYDLSDDAMTIYVVPTGRVYFTSSKKTINYITCTLPRPSSTAKSTASTTIAIDGNSNPSNFYTRTTPSKSAVLRTTITLTTSGVSSFTICGDGFSVLSGSKAFGFGYGNFYNQFAKSGGYWGVDKDDLYLFCHEVTNPGSCQRDYMKAIPFSVLWDMAMNYRK